MKCNIGYMGYQKCIDKADRHTKGYFLYFAQKIDAEYGEGTRVVAPFGSSSVFVSPEQFGKLDLHVGHTYEAYVNRGYIEFDSLKEVVR